MPIVLVNDIDMHYEIYGTGEPLVLIAGLGTDLTIYRPIIDRLSQSFRVLAFDNRGVGQTSKPDTPYSIEMMAQDTVELMGIVGIEQANILGISMGGRIAIAIALQFPEHVKKLLLASTFAGARKSRWFFSKLIKRIRSTISPTTQPYYAFLRQLEATRQFDCQSRLKDIHQPTLILHGESDFYHLAEELHAGIRQSTLISFKGGHMFFLWEHRRFSDTVTGFLTL